MSILYKYTSFENARYILRNQCLPLCHFRYYNDPFEFSSELLSYDELIDLLERMPENQRKEYLESLITKLSDETNISNVNRDTIIQASTSAITASALKGTGIAIASGISTFSILGAALVVGGAFIFSQLSKNGTSKEVHTVNVLQAENFLIQLIRALQNTYTTCFSSKPDEFLMWSHYADSHKGIVIGFSTDFPPFSNNKPAKVKYLSSLSALKSDIIIKGNAEEYVKTTLLRKHKRWEYENEYRFLFDVKKNENDIIWYDHYSNPIIALSNRSIDSIYFGCKCCDKIDEICNLLETLYSCKKLDKIKIKKCSLSKSDYNIKLVDC